MNYLIRRSKQIISYTKILYISNKKVSRLKPSLVPFKTTIKPINFFSDSNKDKKDVDGDKIPHEKSSDKKEEKPEGDKEPNNNDKDPKNNKLKEFYDKYGIFLLVGSGLISLYIYQTYFGKKSVELTMSVIIFS